MEVESYIRKRFLPEVRAKWKKSGRKQDYFKKKEASWLEEEIFPQKTAAVPGPGPGRKAKSFGNSSERTQRRKVVR